MIPFNLKVQQIIKQLLKKIDFFDLIIILNEANLLLII